MVGQKLNGNVDMKMSRVVVAAMVVLGWALGAASGGQWKSADGVMELTLAEGAGLTKVENPPAPFEDLWMTKDGAIRVAITKVALPANVKRLEKKGLEEGLLEEIKGRLISSESKALNGHEVFVMSAAMALNGVDMHIRQAVFVHGGQGYKVMACVTGNDEGNLRRASACVDSLRIIAAGSSGGTGGAGEAGDFTEWGVTEWSQKIGGAAGLVLIGAGIVDVVRRASQGRKKGGG